MEKCPAFLAAWCDCPEQASPRHLHDRQVDKTCFCHFISKYTGVISFENLVFLLHFTEFLMNICIFREQNDAIRVPVQPRHWMDSARLSGALIVAEHGVGQCAGVPLRRRMNQYTALFLNSQTALVLI